MPKLTAAQVWYVTRVQPERVTIEEAQKVYDSVIGKWDIDPSYWDASARALNDLTLDADLKRALEILKTTVEWGSLATPGANRSEIIRLLKALDVEGTPDA